MVKVCFFGIPAVDDFHGYHIESLDPAPYFQESRYRGGYEFLTSGLNGFNKLRALNSSEGLDALYRDRDTAYMRFLRDFVDRYQNYDVIVMNHNVVHPDVLCGLLKKPIKILGLHDSPQATYIRQLAYLWAFDGAFYWSPSLDEQWMSADALATWGCANTYWFPVTPRMVEYPRENQLFSGRDIEVVYIGKMPDTKLDRLLALKRHFGDRLRVNGRWHLRGWGGFIRALWGKSVFPYRVRALSDMEKYALYRRAKIGVNFHLSDHPAESGNLRMFEVPANGAMLVCDKGSFGAHMKVLRPKEEAVYFDTIPEAIDLIEYYLSHDDERQAIARSGFERIRRDFDWHTHLKMFLDWCITVSHRTFPASPSVRLS